MSARPLNGAERTRALATIRARGETHCWRCGTPVDWTKPGTDRDGPTIGHLVEIDAGGSRTDPANYRLEHNRCNTSAGAKYRTEKLRALAKRTTTSRRW